MIVGDSITQGRDGDHTWRYRLWRHFRSHGVTASFVGPWRGTWVPPENGPSGPEPHALAARCGIRSPAPVHTGRYRDGAGFEGDRHYASWGRLLHEAKDNIGDAVAAHGADHLMVALGFNDLAWGVRGPGQALRDLATFVRRAREANPDVQLLVANIVQRTPLREHPNLGRDTALYNRLLPARLAELSTARSRAVPVDIAAVYDPYDDAYDGVHPNDSGELKIARAFAGAYMSAFGVRPRLPARPGVTPGQLDWAAMAVRSEASRSGAEIIGQ